MRKLIFGAVFLLAACASQAPAPDAARAPPPPNAGAPAPPAPPAAAADAGVASGVTLPPEPPRAPPRSGDITVPGGRERPIESPTGDNRTNSERMADIRAWDRCVMRAQGVGEGDPLRPQMTTPEELCSRQLGMASREAVPDSRR